jgi:hypothetical protein
VLFVGATRAKRLLGLAIHNNQRATVEKIFNDNHISFVTTENL